MLISNSLAPTGLWKCSIFRKCTTHLLSTKQKPPTPSPLPPLIFSHLPSYSLGHCFNESPLSPSCCPMTPLRLRALPTAFGSPAPRGVPRVRSQEDGPRRSERVGVGADQSRKGRGDQRSSRRAALNRNVRDEIKSTGLEILLTQTHGCTQDTLALCITWWDLFLS